jgi:hypothetical protein
MPGSRNPDNIVDVDYFNHLERCLDYNGDLANDSDHHRTVYKLAGRYPRDHSDSDCDSGCCAGDRY